MSVVFTSRAKRNYHSIKKYLSDKWGASIAEAFEQKTIDFLYLLEQFPEIGTNELPEKQIRGFQLTQQTKVFYRLKGKQIIILALFDVRQDPEKRPT